MLVEVSVGLFPGLCHCVLGGGEKRKAGFDCNDCQWSIYEKILESSFEFFETCKVQSLLVQLYTHTHTLEAAVVKEIFLYSLLSNKIVSIR